MPIAALNISISGTELFWSPKN